LDHWARRIFLQEIEIQCYWGLIAYDRMIAAIEEIGELRAAGERPSCGEVFRAHRRCSWPQPMSPRFSGRSQVLRKRTGQGGKDAKSAGNI
jgi:hypothetical protein